VNSLSRDTAVTYRSPSSRKVLHKSATALLPVAAPSATTTSSMGPATTSAHPLFAGSELDARVRHFSSDASSPGSARGHSHTRRKSRRRHRAVVGRSCLLVDKLCLRPRPNQIQLRHQGLSAIDPGVWLDSDDVAIDLRLQPFRGGACPRPARELGSGPCLDEILPGPARPPRRSRTR
jgi:hypothetical protein